MVKLKQGDLLHRFYNAAFEPVYFDKSLEGRLNAPDGSYGVLYAAAKPKGAFAETFLRTAGRRMLDSGLVDARAYVVLEATAPLTFIQLDGPGLAILGATAEVIHSGGPPYPNAQSWSLELYGHPLNADGIAYTSRHDPHEICLAVFDRAAHAIREIKRETNLDDDWFWELADAYEMGQPPS